MRVTLTGLKGGWLCIIIGYGTKTKNRVHFDKIHSARYRANSKKTIEKINPESINVRLSIKDETMTFKTVEIITENEAMLEMI